MLIEIHMLQNHAPSNLNRDDTGSPKDCIFGGVRRGRISSQCLKRSVRVSETMKKALTKSVLGIRSRQFPKCVNQYVFERIKGNLSEEDAKKIAEMCQVKCTGLANKEGKESDSGEMPQTVFFSDSDVKTIGDFFLKLSGYLPETLSEVSPEKILKNLKDLKMKEIQKSQELKTWRPITPDIALFGRMTTSDAFVDVEASTQVAHAISVNKMDQEFDFFTAVDDLQEKGTMEDAGADMMGDIEFTSACFYKYFSIDCAGLVDNLTGQSKDETTVEQAKMIAKEVIPAFIEAAVFATPSGKQNSFAAHQLPDAILVEVKEENIPVSYANAFLKPIVPSRDKDLSEAAIEALKTYKENIQHKYGLRISHSFWFTTKDIRIEKTIDCDTLSILLEKTKTLL